MLLSAYLPLQSTSFTINSYTHTRSELIQLYYKQTRSNFIQLDYKHTHIVFIHLSVVYALL